MPCPVCGNDPADGRLCHECTADWLRRLEWLRRIGMPVLREVAYRRVRFREHGHAPLRLFSELIPNKNLLIAP